MYDSVQPPYFSTKLFAMEVTVTLDGGGLHFSSNTDLFKAGQIIAFLNAATPLQGSGSPNLQTTRPFATLGTPNKTSPRQAILDANARTNPQKIAVLAQYWKDMGDNGKETFNSMDLKPLFARAGEPTPMNFNRDLREAKRLNYIYEPQSEGEFVLTEYGEEMIRTRFQEAEAAPRRTSPESRRSSQVKTLNEAVQNLKIMPTLDGYPLYHRLETKAIKILWILAFAVEHKIEALSSGEIEYIAHKLRDKIPSNSLTPLTQGSYKRGFITRNKEGKWEILQDGLDFLKTSSPKEHATDSSPNQ
jgi:hypothetical protein